jgi:flavodoxin
MRSIKSFLDNIPSDVLKNKKAAAFDTRIKGWAQIFGWAARRIADTLTTKGASLVAPPEGFIVKATKGPLVEGELERAAAWAKNLPVK